MKTFIDKILIFILTFVLLIFLRLHLSLRGFGSLVKLLKKKRNNRLNENKIKYLIKSIEILSSIIPNISCLLKASALKIIFRESNDLKLVIGINVNQYKVFESHAWILHKDKVILNNDSKIKQYKIIYEI
ncbi:MAG: lasso peptide biosynthesis B2 protein [Gammaproteobacteria bacterium]